MGDRSGRPSLVIDARVVDNSGLGRYFRNVVSGIVAAERYDITLLGPADRLARHPWTSATRVISFTPPLYSIGEQIGLPRCIPACDLFWSPHYNVPLLPIRSRHRLVTIHDVLHMAQWSERSLAEKLYVTLTMNGAVTRSDAVITVSDYSRREIVRHVRSRARRIEVIYNAIEPDFAQGAAGEPRPADYLLFVGNIKPHKNLRTALRAFQQLLPERPGYQFLIAGKKEGFLTGDGEIDGIVAGFPAGVIQFAGEVGDHELKQLYRNAKALVFPSLYEGFGLPVLEAMAFDTPIIASNTTSVPEVGGDAIEYFNPLDADSILAAMRKVTAPGFTIDQALYAAQRARFSLATCVARHLAVIDSICGRRAAA